MARVWSFVLLAVVCFNISIPPALGQDPGLSWLSRSIELGPQFVAAPTTRTRTPWIVRSDIDDVRQDAFGILPSGLSGVPSDFWGLSPVSKLEDLLRTELRNALPAARSLKLRIMMAELDAPRGAGRDGDLLLARVDGLLAIGAVDQAEALLSGLQSFDPYMFQRWFDIGLLTGRAQDACAEMLGNAGVRPTLPARIFCLARSGDWQAAALTLRAASSLGDIDPAMADLLARFLDPEMFEGAPDPPAISPLTPLVFTMREALSLPRSARRLPPAYLDNDIRGYFGWKAQLDAMERLVRAQALPPQQLIDLYLSASPSASGGVWERVRAIHRLDQTIASRDPLIVGAALETAYQELSRAGLEFALVRPFLPRIADLDLSGPARELRFFLALMHQSGDALAPALIGLDRADPFLVSVTQNRLGAVTAQTDLERAVLAGLSGAAVGNGSHFRALMAASRKGEAVLRALAQADRSLRRDPAQLQAVIAALVAAGLPNDARAIAIQAMILHPRPLQ